MVIVRYTFRVKVGCQSEVIKLVPALFEEQGATPRICSYVYGPWSIIISDIEFETVEDHLKWQAASDWSGPKATEWIERHADLLESDITVEVLMVH